MALMKTCEPAGILPMHRKREFPSRSRIDSVKLRLEFWRPTYLVKDLEIRILCFLRLVTSLHG